MLHWLLSLTFCFLFYRRLHVIQNIVSVYFTIVSLAYDKSCARSFITSLVQVFASLDDRSETKVIKFMQWQHISETSSLLLDEVRWSLIPLFPWEFKLEPFTGIAKVFSSTKIHRNAFRRVIVVRFFVYGSRPRVD